MVHNSLIDMPLDCSSAKGFNVGEQSCARAGKLSLQPSNLHHPLIRLQLQEIYPHG